MSDDIKLLIGCRAECPTMGRGVIEDAANHMVLIRFEKIPHCTHGFIDNFGHTCWRTLGIQGLRVLPCTTSNGKFSG